MDIFDDRLVIYSPGGMPDGTQIQERDIDDIPSTRRNPILADIFARYKEGMEPTFRSNRVEFTVKLPNLNYIIVKTSLSRSTVQRVMKELTEMGRLKRIGSKKNGSWVVKD